MDIIKCLSNKETKVYIIPTNKPLITNLIQSNILSKLVDKKLEIISKNLQELPKIPSINEDLLEIMKYYKNKIEFKFGEIINFDIIKKILDQALCA
jgi:hypothetical protein